MLHAERKLERVVILTALPIEYEAVRRHLRDLREETHLAGTIYERGTFSGEGGDWEVCLVQIGVGNDEAALATERAIAHFEPKLVFFVGIADGLKDVVPGDVVVATKVYGYESGKALGTRFLPRPDVGKASYRLVERARVEARKSAWLQRISDQTSESTLFPRVHLGPIAAGEKVVGTIRSAVFRLLQTTYGDTLCIETGSKGLLLAAHMNEQVQALIVRGVAKLIDVEDSITTQAAQALAAHHASAFAFEVLARLDRQQTISVAPVNDLRLVDLYIDEDDTQPVLDITLQNNGTQVALPLRAKVDILDVGEFYYGAEDDFDIERRFLATTHTYTLELSPGYKGKSKTVKIAHHLEPGETDRFQLALDQDNDNLYLAYVWYYLKITIIYNEQKSALESMPFLLSIPPVDVELNNVWETTSGLYAQQNRILLHRMAALAHKRSYSVEQAILRFS